MKELFKKLEDRQWDWFGETLDKDPVEAVVFIGDRYSLADLLANKSWCKAVWGSRRWIHNSAEAFHILQHEGEQACIEYIKKTMV